MIAWREFNPDFLIVKRKLRITYRQALSTVNEEVNQVTMIRGNFDVLSAKKYPTVSVRKQEMAQQLAVAFIISDVLEPLQERYKSKASDII